MNADQPVSGVTPPALRISFFAVPLANFGIYDPGPALVRTEDELPMGRNRGDNFGSPTYPYPLFEQVSNGLGLMFPDLANQLAYLFGSS